MVTVKIIRYDDDGATTSVHSTAKFDSEQEAKSFAYFDPFVLAENQFDIYKRDGALMGGGYYAEIR